MPRCKDRLSLARKTNQERRNNLPAYPTELAEPPEESTAVRESVYVRPGEKLPAGATRVP